MQTGNLTKLLVIEDNINDSYLLTHQLARAQIEDCVTVISNGKEALDFLLNASPLPIAIFLDLNLPGLGGVHLLKMMRKDPRLREIPVIVMTGSMEAKNLEECTKLGVTDYLVKPISLSTFIKTVTHLFPTHGAPQVPV
jgi:CheY-like chemotaxis protein